MKSEDALLTLKKNETEKCDYEIAEPPQSPPGVNHALVTMLHPFKAQNGSYDILQSFEKYLDIYSSKIPHKQPL